MRDRKHLRRTKRWALSHLLIASVIVASACETTDLDPSEGVGSPSDPPRAKPTTPVASEQAPIDAEDATATWFEFLNRVERDSWIATTDGVMADRPNATLDISDGVLSFVGQTSTKPTLTPSARTVFQQRSIDEDSVFELRVRGDGRGYGFEILTSSTMRGRPVRFRGVFPTSSDWATVRIRPAEMEPLVYGQSMGRAGARRPTVTPDLSAISGIGIAASEREPGSFRVEVDAIRVLQDPR